MNMKIKRCGQQNCTKKPSFAVDGSSKAHFCSEHKEEGMVDVVYKERLHSGCSKRPSYGVDGSGKREFCHEHMKACGSLRAPPRPGWSTSTGRRAGPVAMLRMLASDLGMAVQRGVVMTSPAVPLPAKRGSTCPPLRQATRRLLQAAAGEVPIEPIRVRWASLRLRASFDRQQMGAPPSRDVVRVWSQTMLQ